MINGLIQKSYLKTHILASGTVTDVSDIPLVWKATHILCKRKRKEDECSQHRIASHTSEKGEGEAQKTRDRI